MSIIQIRIGTPTSYTAGDVRPGALFRIWVGVSSWWVCYDGVAPTDAECRAFCEPTVVEADAEKKANNRLAAKDSLDAELPLGRVLRVILSRLWKLDKPNMTLQQYMAFIKGVVEGD